MNVRTLAILLLLLCGMRISSALDAPTRISLRNTYTTFERAMERSQNDITECLDEFHAAIKTYKDALRMEPDNREISEQLLVLVNALGDASETYYSGGEKKQETDCALSEKYFRKAGICYQELTALYPQKTEFGTRQTNAFRLSRCAGIRVLVKELNERKQVDMSLLTLEKLSNARQQFSADYGEDKDLWGIMLVAVQDFERRVGKLFSNLASQPLRQLGPLIELVKAEKSVAQFSGILAHKDKLKSMEDIIVADIVGVVQKYRTFLQSAQASFDGKRYWEAVSKLQKLLDDMKGFPYYKNADQELAERINNETKSFNLAKFREDVTTRLSVATENAECQDLVESGRIAFNASDWLKAYEAFKQAETIAQENELTMDVSVIPEWLKKTEKKIRGLDEDEIGNITLAIVHYDAISYEQWHQESKEGSPSKKPVYMSSSYLTQTDGIFSDVVHLGNGAGLIFRDRLNLSLAEKMNVVCIAKYRKTATYVNRLQGDHEVPVFNVIWYRRLSDGNE